MDHVVEILSGLVVWRDDEGRLRILDVLVRYRRQALLAWADFMNAALVIELFDRTGRRLYDELQPLGFTLQPRIETLYYREENRTGFLNRFAAILEHLRNSRRAPIIHIEAHGLLDTTGQSIGFALASGEMVTWADLAGC